MSRGFQSPQPGDEIARRLANLERQMERLVRMPPTAPSEVTAELADLSAGLADLDGHIHGYDHTHDISAGSTTVYFRLQSATTLADAYIQVGGAPPGDADGSFHAYSVTVSDTGSPTPTDVDPWVAP